MDFGSLASIVVTLALAGVGGIVWLVRLEGKINVLKSRGDAIDKRVDGMEERIFAQLDRIETRLFALTAKE